MSRLTELRNQHLGETGGNTDVPGTIRNMVAYTTPIDALHNGKPVRLIATGDIAGMSPAEKFVDEAGRIDWAPSDEFVVDDRSVVPQSADQRYKLAGGNLTGSSR